MRRLAPIAMLMVLASLLFLFGARDTFSRSASATPRLIVWAWERPEDLRFLSDNVGVAYLAGSIDLLPQPVLRPRLQPLRVTERTAITAVVRIETSPQTPPSFSPEYRDRVAELALEASTASQVSALQIDFDAIASQRDFYRDLLKEIRRRLPPSMPLSITALGSWCMGDDWIADLPIDDAVPMMFRMGPDRAQILRTLNDGEDFKEPLCRHSVGVSTDEPWPESLLNRQVYVFNPRAWNRYGFQVVERKLQP